MGTQKVILVADDDVMLRNLVRQFLQDKGYEVLVAADEYEAKAMSRGHQGYIDLLLTDVEMPHMDGISAYRRISAERPDMKVLFMSGATIESELIDQRPFIGKPFKTVALLAKMHEILNGPAIGDNKGVVLVVDHLKDRKERTQTILSDNGYAVLTASSVDEADAVAAGAEKIDLIVSEVMFPGHNGVQLAERQDFDRNIDTLLISHFHLDLLHKVPGFSRQAEFLANPFTPEDLLTRVGRFVKTLK